jgi:hypothetical protein
LQNPGRGRAVRGHRPLLVVIGMVLSAVGLSYINSGKADNESLAIAGLVVSRHRAVQMHPVVGSAIS